MNEERILDKLDAIEDQNTDMLVALGQMQEQLKGLPDHEQRIRSLEQWKWGLTGVLGLLTTGFTAWSTTKGA